MVALNSLSMLAMKNGRRGRSRGAWYRDPGAPMRAPRLLTCGLAALMFAQALSGLVLSEQYRDPEPIRTTWFGNDWITLVLAVPLLLAGLAVGIPRAGCCSGSA
jgi:hypothetical protein